jgi:hypothetical protein
VLPTLLLYAVPAEQGNTEFKRGSQTSLYPTLDLILHINKISFIPPHNLPSLMNLSILFMLFMLFILQFPLVPTSISNLNFAEPETLHYYSDPPYNAHPYKLTVAKPKSNSLRILRVCITLVYLKSQPPFVFVNNCTTRRLNLHHLQTTLANCLDNTFNSTTIFNCLHASTHSSCRCCSQTEV